MALHRYRVKSGSKTWTDKGPDLLRPADNAAAQVLTILKSKTGPFEYRLDTKPKVTGRRGEVMSALLKYNWQVFRVYLDGKNIVSVKHIRMEILATNCASKTVAEYRTLAETQFPDIKFAGAFVYPDYLGSTAASGWSDHAWGDAFDETPKDAAGNDALFDWYCRMAQEGCMDYGYVLGSRKGTVWSCSEPDYKPVAGGGDSSHLWHNHVSVINHHGAKPPTATGYC